MVFLNTDSDDKMGIGKTIGVGTIVLSFAGFLGSFVTSHVHSSRLEQGLEKKVEKPHSIRDTYNTDILPPVYRAFGEQYKPQILGAATKYDVPPEYIVGAIVEENYARMIRDDIFDTFALLCGKIFPNRYGIEYSGKTVDSCYDPSLGIGQIRRSVGKKLAAKYEEKQLSISEITTELQDTDRNIDYIAMVLADLTHPPNSRPPQGDYFDTHYTSIIGTRYVKGPTDTPLEIARSSCEGMHFVEALSNFPSRTVFGEGQQRITQGQQDELRQYAVSELPKLCKDPSPAEQVQTALARI